MSLVVYTVLKGLALTDILLWTFLGALSGVLIDVDHAVLSMVIKKRYSKGLRWFRDPIGAVTRPSEFLDDMEYDRLIYHRIVSHTVILGLLMYLSGFYSILVPVSIGVGAHLVSDIVYDLHGGSYWFQA